MSQYAQGAQKSLTAKKKKIKKKICRYFFLVYLRVFSGGFFSQTNFSHKLTWIFHGKKLSDPRFECMTLSTRFPASNHLTTALPYCNFLHLRLCVSYLCWYTGELFFCRPTDPISNPQRCPFLPNLSLNQEKEGSFKWDKQLNFEMSFSRLSIEYIWEVEWFVFLSGRNLQ